MLERSGLLCKRAFEQHACPVPRLLLSPTHHPMHLQRQSVVGVAGWGVSRCCLPGREHPAWVYRSLSSDRRLYALKLLPTAITAFLHKCASARQVGADQKRQDHLHLTAMWRDHLVRAGPHKASVLFTRHHFCSQGISVICAGHQQQIHEPGRVHDALGRRCRTPNDLVEGRRRGNGCKQVIPTRMRGSARLLLLQAAHKCVPPAPFPTAGPSAKRKATRSRSPGSSMHGPAAHAAKRPSTPFEGAPPLPCARPPPAPTGYAARLAQRNAHQQEQARRARKGPRYAASTMAYVGKRAPASHPSTKVWRGCMPLITLAAHRSLWVQVHTEPLPPEKKA